MSEKEIIEYLERSLNDDWNYYNCTKVKDRMAIQGILNLYKGTLNLYKQEKEKNKKLKKENEALEIIHKSYKEMIEENDLISKDKIRAKIKEIIQGSSRFNVLCKINENEETIKTRYAVQVLTKLLEENKSDENNI